MQKRIAVTDARSGSRPGRSPAEVRLGIVGRGRQAERGHVPAAARANGVALVAVADTERARCEKAAPGIPAYGSIEELLGGEDLDAVVIATPTAQHLSCARIAARAVVPALVEKPPARDAAEASELAAVSPAPRLGFNRRFDPALDPLKAELAKEERFDLRLRLHFPIVPGVPMSPTMMSCSTSELISSTSSAGSPAPRSTACGRGPRAQSGSRSSSSSRPAAPSSPMCGEPVLEEEAIADDPNGRRIAAHVRGGLVKVALARLRLRRRDDGFVTSLARQLEAFAAEIRVAGGPSWRGPATESPPWRSWTGPANRRGRAASGARWRFPFPRA